MNPEIPARADPGRGSPLPAAEAVIATRNATQAVICALEREVGGVAVVWYPEPNLLEWHYQEVAGLAEFDPAADVLRVASVDEAIGASDRLVLLVPRDERACVEELEGRLGQLLEPARSQPVVLFLLRDGEGQDQLARSPELSSWVRGRDPDPDRIAEIDPVAERARFEAEVGRSVEAWLDDWRAERIARNGVSYALMYLATLLEDR